MLCQSINPALRDLRNAHARKCDGITPNLKAMLPVQYGNNTVLLDVLSRPAEEFDNDQSVEAMWAMKAYEHAEIYFNILCSVDPKILRLTPEDDLIYKLFREEFPNLDVQVIIENELKSTKEKAKWRPFCEKFKTVVEDYSYGTLLRSDASKDYCEDNTILVTRIQFYAIEIARNKEGVNDILRNKFKPEPIDNELKKIDSS